MSIVFEIPGWLREKGDRADVVVSSRVRLARNLNGHLFPAAMSRREELEVRDEVIGAFKSLPGGTHFTIIYMEDTTQTEKRMLLERTLVSQEFSISRNKVLVLRDDERFAAMINEEDHLRSFAIRGGLNLRDTHRDVDAVDTQLERNLPFAVVLRWGYLTAALRNVGTGMRASVMLHLPALVMTGLIDRIVKEINQAGLSVRAFFGSGKDSLGSLYQVSNVITLGLAEQSILENLESVAVQVVDYERRAREEMLNKRKTELEDKVMRAYGILQYCRYLSWKEAVARLSRVRLGILCGIIEVRSVLDVTALMFVSQKSHVRRHVGSQEEAVDTRSVDHARANYIRDALTKGLTD